MGAAQHHCVPWSSCCVGLHACSVAREPRDPPHGAATHNLHNRVSFYAMRTHPCRVVRIDLPYKGPEVSWNKEDNNYHT